MSSRRSTEAGAKVIGGLLLLGLALLIIKWALITIARATIDAAGGCGWCGSRIAHRDQHGTLVRPLDFHSAEIEETLAAQPVH